jgi:regulatory protein
MPVITKIAEPPRRPSRRRIYLDGKFALTVNLNVIAKFRLREGKTISDADLRAIEQGHVRQTCLDHALRYLSHRLHSRQQLRQKLLRKSFMPAMIEDVLDQLTQLAYLDDARFAQSRALAAAQHKHHGRRRAMAELLKAGVPRPVAERALTDVYADADPLAIARQLALKHAPRLKKLDPVIARRRLIGLLQRRGFDYDSIHPLLDEILGPQTEF